MKSIRKIFIIFSFIIAITMQARPVYFYSWVDGLSIRNRPGLKSKVIGYLKAGQKVLSLKRFSRLKTKITLRCTAFNTRWLKVKTGKGKTGWVYKGALTKKRPVTNWKVIIAYFPGKPDEVSEDWSFFIHDLSKFGKKKGIKVHGFYQGDPVCMVFGNRKSPHAYLYMRKFIKKYKSAKYIFFRKGKRPKVVEYEPPFIVIKKARRYFK